MTYNESFRCRAPLVNAQQLFSFITALILAADWFHRTTLIAGYTWPEVAAVLVIYASGLLVFMRYRVRVSRGVRPLLALWVVTLVVHGYINFGLLFHCLLVVALLTVGLKPRMITAFGLAYLTSLLVVVGGIAFMNRNLFFLREFDLPHVALLGTPLSNPNVYSRTIVILLPFLLVAREKRMLARWIFLVLLGAATISVLFVAMSRANSLALIVMLVLWRAQNPQRSLLRVAGYALTWIAVFAIVVWAVDPLQAVAERASVIVDATRTLLSQDDTGLLLSGAAPKRARTWAASLLLVREAPLFGVGGPNVHSQIARLGVSNIAVHGGLLNVVTATGMMGLTLFLTSLAVFYKEMNSAGRAFLAGTLISQIGADVYTHTIFWVVLSVLLYESKSGESLRRRHI